MDCSPNPCNLELESRVLGTLLVQPYEFVLHQDMLSEKLFYDVHNQRVYSAMVELRDSGHDPDMMMVGDLLKRNGLTLPPMHLVDLGMAAGLPSSLTYALGELRKYQSRREIKQLSQQIQNMSDEEPIEEVLSFAQGKLIDIAHNTTVDRPKTYAEILDAVLPDIANRKGRVNRGITTTFQALDNLIGGFAPGEVTVLAARPGMGKSALAATILENIAITTGRPVLFVSLEMSNEQMIYRFLSRRSGIAFKQLSEYEQSTENVGSLYDVRYTLNDVPLYLYQGAGKTLPSIMAQIRRLQIELKDVAIVAIDYLHLIDIKGKEEDLTAAVSTLSERVKRMALQLQIPILLLSQLNRENEKRQTKTPQLSDLRQSGAIEQDADIVLLLHRDDKYNKESTQRGIVEVIVAKNRNGATGSVELYFQDDTTMFMEKSW